MALVKRKAEKQETVYTIRKIAVAYITRTKVKVAKFGENAFLLIYKKKSSKFHIQELVHKSQIVSISGGATDLDGEVTYRAVNTLFEGRGTIAEIDSTGISFVDANGSTNFVPVSADSGIVMSITSDGIDLAKSVDTPVKKKKKGSPEPKFPPTSEKKVKSQKPRGGALPPPSKK